MESFLFLKMSAVSEFSAEKLETTPAQIQTQSCSFDLPEVHPDHHPDCLKLDISLPCPYNVGLVLSQPSREETANADELWEADWSDPEETELENLAISNLDMIFRSAIKKLASFGYSEEVALRAILKSGLCYGSIDMVTNTVENTLAFLCSIHGMVDHTSSEHHHHHFGHLQQLEKYVLAEMVCVLREVRPFLSVGDAMWCLLICEMNISHACVMYGDSFSDASSEGNSNRILGSNISKGNEDSSSSNVSFGDGSTPISAVPCS
ncbi:hypothetical protein SAY86_028576 [Trapa natans]|uniref:PIR2-like helical domain-containing protein n=1 Tax=Trapa natans TaxID=22666 RepID=A0AAN7RCC2_TRANT|nr:hypothetical protein SAY86_028576 [Trapa natans]